MQKVEMPMRDGPMDNVLTNADLLNRIEFNKKLFSNFLSNIQAKGKNTIFRQKINFTSFSANRFLDATRISIRGCVGPWSVGLSRLCKKVENGNN